MTNLSAAKAILAADTTLTTTATGGIYTPNDLGRMGLNPSNPQATVAFNTDGSIKPCIVLKIRSNQPVDGLGDDGTQRVGQREMMEVWCYQDNGYSSIDTIRARVFVDLQGKRLSGAACRWAFDDSPRHDMDLDACFQRMDFAITSVR